jgi:hypothetical protein
MSTTTLVVSVDASTGDYLEAETVPSSLRSPTSN